MSGLPLSDSRDPDVPGLAQLVLQAGRGGGRPAARRGVGSGTAESLFEVRNKIRRLRFCYYGFTFFPYLAAGASCPHPPASCLDSIGSVLRSDVDDCGLMKNKIHRLEKGNIISKLEVVR